ncbi:MAG: hypothetical protein ACYTGK_20465 [Planctomycetota bacterium]
MVRVGLAGFLPFLHRFLGVADIDHIDELGRGLAQLAMGARLKIVAEFPDGELEIRQFGK